MHGATTSPVAAPDSGPQKRPSVGGEPPRRPKRGKYTPVACDECKKRKLKCIPVDEGSCERCIASSLTCTYAAGPSQATRNKHESQQVRTLSEDLAQLRQQVADLAGTVKTLKNDIPHQRPPSASAHSQDAPTLVQSPSASGLLPPKAPQFVGPTRPSYGFIVGERSLTRMGIPSYESPPPSGAQSPSEDDDAEPLSRPPLGVMTNEAEFWLHCTPAEVSRLLSVFEEEVESVYPFIDIVELSSRAQQILDVMRNRRPLDMAEGLEMPVTLRDIEMTKIAVATGLVIEGHGKTELSTAMAESVERQVSRISSPEVELKEVQLLTMLSIYYFHCDEDLLAWRTIGIAAREALEMGLHRRKSLFDNFKDADSRRLATRVFWCVYVLDRRWSFGTSLSFALADRDIDPNLPEPDADFSYLKCMVGYARLCSRLWEAIPPFGSASQAMPEEAVQSLDLKTQDWLESIPSHLRLRHPRLGLAARSQPRLLQRLRALLYLRGNHTRISIYQHYLLSASSIMANLQSAWLVVNIAQDSVQVLVHLNATTDIYSRQQNAFNYFLLSALAVIFLSVCHAPNVFTEPCRKCFLDAVELVRGFSRHSAVSRRLWKSIRGLLPRLKSLGIQSNANEGQQQGEMVAVVHRQDSVAGSTTVAGPCNMPTADTMGSGSDFQQHQQQQQEADLAAQQQQQQAMRAESGAVTLWDARTNSDIMADTELSGSVPDMFQMRNDLLDLFDALGQGQNIPGEFGTNFYSPGETDTFNRRLQGLI